MQVGIATTNQLKRQEYLRDTVTQFKDLGYDVYLNIDDGTKGIRVNKYECVMKAGKLAIEKNTGLLFCEDDIQICKGFEKYIEDLDGEFLFYSLFHFPDTKIINRVAVKEYIKKGRIRVFDTTTAYNEQCIYVPRERVKEYLDLYQDFYDRIDIVKQFMVEENHEQRTVHPDICFIRYMKMIGQKMYAIYPDLVQHIGKTSGVGNRIIRQNFSNAFLDDLREVVCKFE